MILAQFKKLALLLFLLISMAVSAFAQDGKGAVYMVWSGAYGNGHFTTGINSAMAIRELDPNATIVFVEGSGFMKFGLGWLSKWGFYKTQGEYPGLYGKIYRKFMKDAKNAKSDAKLPSVGMMSRSAVMALGTAVMPHAILDAWYTSAEWRIALVAQGFNPYVKAKGAFWETDWTDEDYIARLARNSLTAVPTSDIKERLIARGAPAENLIVTGMFSSFEPAGPKKIRTSAELKTEALEALEALEIRSERTDFRKDVPTYFIEGGAVGGGNYPLMAASLALRATAAEPIQIVAACGMLPNPPNLRALGLFGSKNRSEQKELYKMLKPLLKEGYSKEQIMALVTGGLGPDVKLFTHGKLRPEEMVAGRRAAELVIAKPGAMSVDGIIMNKARALINASHAAGQEETNVEYLAKEKKVIRAFKGEESIGRIAYEFKNDAEGQRQMEIAQDQYIRETDRTVFINMLMEAAQEAFHASQAEKTNYSAEQIRENIERTLSKRRARNVRVFGPEDKVSPDAFKKAK